MALKRSALSAMGIEADKIDLIIEMHTDSINALKSERDTLKNERDGYKADAEKLPAVQKELDTLKAEAAKNSGDAYKVKYEAIKKEYEEYKTEVTTKETKTAKEKAFRGLLEKEKVSSKILEKVIKVSGDIIDGIEFDDKGEIKDAETLTKGIQEEWGDFIETTSKNGAETPKPPAGNGGENAFANMSLAEKMEYANDHPGEQAVKDWLANPFPKKAEEKKE